MNSKLTIRAPSPEDHGEWLELWRGYNAFYGRSGATALSGEVEMEAWSRLMDEASSIHGLVAQQNEKLIGLAHFIFHANMLQIQPTCYLQDLFTATKARGAGVGRALIEALIEQCRDAGVRDIYWHTHSDNAAARHLYDKLATDTGFVVYRRSF